MKLYSRLGLGYISRYPWHSLLCLVGIGLGIAVVLAVDVANHSAKRAFTLTNAAISAGSSHVILGGPAGIDETQYVRLRVKHGLRNIRPIVSGYVTMGGERFLLVGIDPFSGPAETLTGAEPDWEPTSLLSAGSPIVLLGATAQRLGLTVSATPTLQVEGRAQTVTVAGTLTPSTEIATGLRNIMVADISTAQEILGMIGKLSRIDVSTDEPDRVESLLPTQLRLVPSESRSYAMEQMTRAFDLNLRALSLLALVIGAFLIYNSMALSVLHRRQQLAVLRTLGMTPGQLFGGIIAEALLLALGGFILGCLAGVWLSGVLLKLVGTTINDLYFVLQVHSVEMSMASLWKAAALAAAATLVAAVHPAWEAMRVSPAVNAMRSSAESQARQRTVYLAAAGLALWFVSLAILLVSSRSIEAGFASLFFVIAGFALITPMVLSRVLTVLSRSSARILGLTGRLACRGVQASLSRTQIAVAALSIAISAVIGVSIMISSFRTSVEHWLNNFLRADVYVAQQQDRRLSGIDRLLIDEVAALPQVDRISTGRWVELLQQSGVTRLFAVDLDKRGFQNFQLAAGDPDKSWNDFASGNAVIVSEPYAYRHGVGLGDSVTLPTDSGDARFPVAGIFYDYGSDQGVVTMHRATYDRFWNDRVISSFALYLLPGTDVETFVQTLNNDQLLHRTLRIRSNKTIRERSLQIFDRTFSVTEVLRLLAICIAVIGVISALLAIQLERAKEFSVLRALGLTSRQLWGLITMESGLMGLVAGIIACPLGLVMAWMLIYVINRRSFGWSLDFYFAPGPWLLALALSVGAALIAGLYPAYRIINTKPARALQYE